MWVAVRLSFCGGHVVLCRDAKISNHSLRIRLKILTSLSPITRIKLEGFTAFESLDLSPSPGINVFVGANGTGKTHIMKAAYSACVVLRTGERFPNKLVRVFLPSRGTIGRLVKRKRSDSKAEVEVRWGSTFVVTQFSKLATSPDRAVEQPRDRPVEHRSSVYIPVKEMLANAPGFRSLYSGREIYFEEVYADVLDRAFLPPPRNGPSIQGQTLLKILHEALEGTVHRRGEEFFVRNRRGELEFTLVAEGLRKLGLLWLLIHNGTLSEGSVLFWDEPETNLNPRLFRAVICILLELQRQGVQIFIATHDYLILKHLDLQSTDGDDVLFHALHRSDDGELECDSTASYLQLHPNAIAEAFSEVYDLEVERSLAKYT